MDTFNYRNMIASYEAVYNQDLYEEMEEYGLIESCDIYEETDKEREERLAKRRARVKEMQAQGRVMTPAKRASQKAAQRREEERAHALEKAATGVIGELRGASGRSSRPMGSEPPKEKEEAPEATRRLPKHLRKDNLGSAADRVLKNLQKEDYEIYELVVDYLIDEGYVDSLESAEVILENMSDEWLEDIMERRYGPDETLPGSGLTPRIKKDMKYRYFKSKGNKKFKGSGAGTETGRERAKELKRHWTYSQKDVKF